MKRFTIFQKIILTALMLVSSQTFAMSPHDISNFFVDVGITTSIKTRVLHTPSLRDTRIDVKTDDGVVLLNATLNSDAEALTLVALAANTKGVKDVDASYLIVKHNQYPLTDLYMTAKVKGFFERNKLYDNNKIIVSTRDEVVYLSGTVTNQEQLHQAIEIAQSVEGVDHVVSHLQLSSSRRLSS